MPKRLIEINKFTGGIISTPSATDTDEQSAKYSLNIDPQTSDGRLQGIDSDKYLTSSGFSSTGTASVVDAVKDAKVGGALKRMELDALDTTSLKRVPDQQQFLQDQLGEVPTTLSNRTAELEARVKEGTLDRMPQDRIEAILLGTNKFTDEGGVQRIIRRFHTEALPLGRTDQEILRRGHRGLCA